MNGRSGEQWIGYQSRPATVLLILAVAMTVGAWLFMAGSAGDPDRGMFTPQTVGEPVQVTLP